MPGSMPLSRAWILLAMVAVLAYAVCATGAGPCSVFKPIGLSASLLAALLLVVAPDGGREEQEAPEREYVERR